MDLKDLFIIENGDLISINEIFNIPSGITNLDSYCFRGCNFIKEINIPATCVDIDRYAFEELDSVLSYNVDKNNPEYASYDGCIYSKDKKKFIKYPKGRNQKNFYFNDEVEIIASCAMNDAPLENVSIGKSVKTIDIYALGDGGRGSKIEKIYMPKNVTEIKDYAFNHYDFYGELIIGGEKGSEAEKFAFKNEILFTEVDESNLDWFFSLSYNEHRKILEEKAKNETEFVVDCPENGYTATFDNGTLTLSAISSGATVESLKERLSKDRRDKIKTVILGDGITHVTKNAFQDYYDLEEVKIGKDVCVFDAECLFGDYNIHKLTVDNENKHFIVKDGILYSSDLKKIVKFPPKQEKEYYEIPSHVKTIGKFAFADTYRLQCIKVGNNVSMIEEGAFACFLDLRHIYIDKDVDIEDSSIFFTYDELRDYICFGGLIVGTKHGSKFEKVFAKEAVSFCHLEDDEIDDFLKTPITLKRWIDVDPYEKRCEFPTIESTLVGYKGKDNRVTIPDNVTVVSELVFHSVEYVFIPKSVVSIDENAFYGCEKLYIEVDKENPAYTSNEGKLYFKNGDEVPLRQPKAWNSNTEDLPF
ncbi:MAG: leucine-rich repeat protein [Clostridia bacterium]|nr:leucine-rich repeat protein [Clostridia bacterium]